MNTVFYAPSLRLPLWAHPQKRDRNLMSWHSALAAAMVIVAAFTYVIAHVDFSARSKPTEKRIVKVAMVNLPPEPKQEEPKKEEPKPLEPPPKPKAAPKLIRQVVKVPPKAPQPEPETAPIAMAPPALGPSSEQAVSIPSAVGPATPPKNTSGAGEIRQGVASLVSCHPDYPSRARERGITGEFVVHMTVDPSGVVTDVKIVSGEPRAFFERDIKRSMSRCKFEPTTTGFIAEAPVVFRMEN